MAEIVAVDRSFNVSQMTHEANEPLDARHTHLEHVAQNLDHLVVGRLCLHLVDHVDQNKFDADNHGNDEGAKGHGSRVFRYCPECTVREQHCADSF